MATVSRFIPLLIEWETGVPRRIGESNHDHFERSRDAGLRGDVLTGVSLSELKDLRKNFSLTVRDLSMMPYIDWFHIIKRNYWDRVRADEIDSQSVAELLADWYILFGREGVRRAQRILGVRTDGTVGNATLTALNGEDPLLLFARLKGARMAHIEEVIYGDSTKRRLKDKWLMRINGIRYEE